LKPRTVLCGGSECVIDGRSCARVEGSSTDSAHSLRRSRRLPPSACQGTPRASPYGRGGCREPVLQTARRGRDAQGARNRRPGNAIQRYRNDAEPRSHNNLPRAGCARGAAQRLAGGRADVAAAASRSSGNGRRSALRLRRVWSSAWAQSESREAKTLYATARRGRAPR
jgi:hypothetical protein